MLTYRYMAVTNETIRKLATYIKKNPDDSFSKFALALEFQKEGMYKRSRMFFENILENDPEYVGVYYHLGKLYEVMGQLADAKNMYEQGIEIADRQQEARTKSELKEALSQLEMELEK